MPQTSLLFIGVKGTVLALDRATGKNVWESRLRGSDFVNIVLEGGALYAATQGELFSLDPATGQIRWHNRLNGFGRGLISIAGERQSVALREKRRRDDEASAIAAADSVVG
jgi:outer membrane protein assembly factor BamB